MRKITKRDVLFFLLGFITLFIIDTITSWDSVKASFKKGYDDARQKEIEAESK